MSYVQVGACPKCGAPIFQPASWMSILPPPSTYSCSCRFGQNTYTFRGYDKMPKFSEKNIKIEIIEALKRYKEDVTTKDEEAAFEVVIEWFINNTPEYKENK